MALLTSGGTLTLPADGFSTLQITAEAAGPGLKANLAVRFRTTGGTFAGVATAEAPIDVPLNANGRAVAVLRSSTRSGPVLVTAQVLEGMNAQPIVSQLQLEFVLPDPNGFRFVEGATTAPADGATFTRLSVQVPSGFPLDQRMVTFKTSLGSFDGATAKMATIPAGSDGRAMVLLYSPIDDGVASVTATLGVFDAETFVTFQPAPADFILVSAPARLVQGQTEVFRVTATLVRRIGAPTLGTIVKFSAFDNDDRSFGSFHNITLSNSTGVATADFRTDGTGAPGNCRLEVRADGSLGVGRAEFLLVAAN